MNSCHYGAIVLVKIGVGRHITNKHINSQILVSVMKEIKAN